MFTMFSRRRKRKETEFADRRIIVVVVSGASSWGKLVYRGGGRSWLHFRVVLVAVLVVVDDLHV